MRNYALLALIVLAGIAPFSSRAVYMDEHIFLKLAQSARENWLFPSDTPGIFFGVAVKNFAGHTHPPVGEYYLALMYSVFRRFSEVPFRLGFSIFSIAAVLAFYFIARRFTEEPFLVALLFALSPAFFVMSPTLMMDIPMLAFLILGFAFYFAHLEARRGCLPAAALMFILAAGTGYTALIPISCLLGLMILWRRPWKECLAALVAPLALGAWQVMMAFHFGDLPVARTVGYFSHANFIANTAAVLSFIGSVALFPWATLLAADTPRKQLLFPAGVVVASLFSLVIHGHSYSYRLWYIALASSGVIFLAAFALAAKRTIEAGLNRGEALFMLWAPAVLIFFVLIGDMINARYILLVLPPIYLILFRRASRRQLLSAIAPTALLALVLAYADFTYVNSYRDWVRKSVPPLQSEGFRIWSAAESGLRFYLERTGISSLSNRDLRPAGSDLIVRHVSLFRIGLSPDVETVLTVLKTFTLTSSFPVRTFSLEAGAGFHGSNVGIVPFVVSRIPLDRIEIAEVSPLVLQLPQQGVPAEDVPAWSPDGVILKQNAPQRVFRAKFPAAGKLEYEIDGGDGVAEREDGAIVLTKSSPATIVWRRLRIVPPEFESQREDQR